MLAKFSYEFTSSNHEDLKRKPFIIIILRECIQNSDCEWGKGFFLLTWCCGQSYFLLELHLSLKSFDTLCHASVTENAGLAGGDNLQFLPEGVREGVSD